MAVFKYTTVTADGGRERGILTAETSESAETLLRERRQTIIRVEQVRSSAADSPYYRLTERPVWERRFAGLLTGSAKIELALDQLAAMLEGGVPILNALQTVAAQSGYFLARAFFCVANRLQSGRSLTDTLREEMPWLGGIVIGMIAAGEANGDIDKMCNYSAELMARRRVLRGQILQALSYPVLVIFVTIGIVTFLMVQVIPKIMKFLSNRSAKLPPITQMLVDVTNFLQANGIYLLLAPVLFAVVLVLLRKSPEIGCHVDRIGLRLPVIGKVLCASSNMLWCRTLGILLRSGINIIPALEYTRDALGNLFYRRELDEIKSLVAQGHPLSTALRVSGLKRHIPLADAMLVVGENTGRMDTGLMEVAEFSDADLQRRIAFLSKMIEPALFVIVGGIVGFVYIAFFLGLMAASTGGR